MTIRLMCATVLFSIGCGVSKSASDSADTASQADAGDGGSADGGADDCNTANEDCAPGECSGDGSHMLPGSDCLACHTPGNLEDDKKRSAPPPGDGDKLWSIGGTVFVDITGSAAAEGAIVRVTDANGDVITLETNSSGNFYTRQEPVWPVWPSIEYDGVVQHMLSPIENGGCNSCHSCGGSAGGKLYVP